MERPEITGYQREMVVTLLANAIRKDAHLRARADQAENHANPLTRSMARRRAEPSQRYVEGMRDLLRVLFADGFALADECMEEAYAQAIGAAVDVPSNGNGTQYH